MGDLPMYGAIVSRPRMAWWLRGVSRPAMEPAARSTPVLRKTAYCERTFELGRPWCIKTTCSLVTL